MKSITSSASLALLVVTTLSACASTMVSSDRQVELRNKLSALQTDPILSRYAPQARAEAEAAVNKVEQQQVSTQVTMHNDFVAHRKIEIAEMKAREAYLLDQQLSMGTNSADARLAARTAEADAANRRAAQLSAELAALNAKPSPRGMIVTMSDVLFANGQASLSPGADNALGQLYRFMANNPEVSLLIEGHTDSVGSAPSNQLLSENRAQAVSTYLQNRGVAAGRLRTQGMGENSPVAGNDSAAGRQQNRRVEIVVVN